MALILFPLGSTTYPATVVRIGLYDNRPKLFLDNNNRPAGIFVDVINEIGRKEGWKIEYVPGTWAECLTNLKTHKIDLMPDMAYSAERNRIYDFTRETVLSSWSQVYSRMDLEIRSILDLNGKTVAVLDNSIQQAELIKLANRNVMHTILLTFHSFGEAFQALENKQVDAAITNRFYGITNAIKYDVKETPVILDPVSLHYVALKGQHKSLLNSIDQRLKELKENKKSGYYRSLDNWLGEKRPTRIPGYIKVAAASLLAILGLSLAFTGLLKWQLNIRTAQLAEKNRKLELALEDLANAQNESIRTEKMHLLGQMASGVAHDFNNVLTPIVGYTELILADDKAVLDKKTKNRMEIIGEAAKDGTEIVKRLKTYYQETEANKPEVTRVGDLLDNVEKMCKPRILGDRTGRKVTINRLDGPVPPLLVKVSEIHEAFLNIINNAIDAMPKGGAININTSSEGGIVSIIFRDDGIGMSSETLQKCLNPFYTTKGSKGTGMGLHITAGIIKRHNGTLSVESQPGKGTSITIAIPEAPKDAPERNGPAKKYSIDPIRILALDDDVRSLESLVAQLVADGHSVEAITDPKQALSKIAEAGFDLIITDHVMPGLNGDELAQAIIQITPNTPIIMVTGQENSLSRANRGSSYIRKILVKPVRLRDMRDAMVELGFGKHIG